MLARTTAKTFSRYEVEMKYVLWKFSLLVMSSDVLNICRRFIISAIRTNVDTVSILEVVRR